MSDAQTIGLRIKRLRLAAGMDQSQLGQRSGIEQQGAISRIEHGRIRLDDELLRSLAAALGCTQDFLTDPIETMPATRPWLRAYADAPKRHVDQQLAQCDLAAEAIERLRLQLIPDSIPEFGGDLEDEEAIEQFALEVRDAAGLEPGMVVANMMRAAERLGCIILPMRNVLGRHLGMSTIANTAPMMCVSRPTDAMPGDRQRFTVAHELAHLGLHRDLPPPNDATEARRIERQAHRFANAFLIPGDDLTEELDEAKGRVTLRTLADIKSRWGIAVKALVVRCRQLGIIDDDHARSLYKQMSSRGWNKSEPVQVGHEKAIWFSKAVAKSDGPGERGIETAARRAGIVVSYLNDWLTWDPVEESYAEVIKMRPPGEIGSTTHEGQSIASVTKITR